MCNLISKYSPEYVRSRALETPGDAFAVLVSSCKQRGGWTAGWRPQSSATHTQGAAPTQRVTGQQLTRSQHATVLQRLACAPVSSSPANPQHLLSPDHPPSAPPFPPKKNFPAGAHRAYHLGPGLLLCLPRVRPVHRQRGRARHAAAPRPAAAGDTHRAGPLVHQGGAGAGQQARHCAGGLHERAVHPAGVCGCMGCMCVCGVCVRGGLRLSGGWGVCWCGRGGTYTHTP